MNNEQWKTFIRCLPWQSLMVTIEYWNNTVGVSKYLIHHKYKKGRWVRLRITNIRIIIIIIRSFRYNHPSYELYPSYSYELYPSYSSYDSGVVVVTEVLSSVVGVNEGLTPIVVLSVVVNLPPTDWAGVDAVMARPPVESRSGLSWVQRLQVKGWAGVPALQRRQVKGAAEVSVVAQSLQMKGCCLVPITHWPQ